LFCNLRSFSKVLNVTKDEYYSLGYEWVILVCLKPLLASVFDCLVG
jgi:hypothetical protein